MSGQRFAAAFSCSDLLCGDMLDGFSSCDDDDFPYPEADHEANFDSSDCEDQMEAVTGYRRVSNSSLWGGAEDEHTPASTAAASSPSVPSHVNFFKDGINLKRLFDDVMEDQSSDCGLAASSTQRSPPQPCFDGIEGWHPNKIFVAVVEFCRPRWSFMLNQHTKVVGKTMNVKKYLTGGSQQGKTSKGVSLFGIESTLKLGCQSLPQGVLPSVAGFDRQRHKAMCFDECRTDQILANREFFQACQFVQSMSQSLCNQHCYDVWAYQTAMIVCSNFLPTTTEAGLSAQDADWMTANVVVVQLAAGQTWFK